MRPPRDRCAAQSARTPPQRAPTRLVNGQTVEVAEELPSPSRNERKTSDGSHARKAAATKLAPTKTPRSTAAAGLDTIRRILSASGRDGRVIAASSTSAG